MECREESTLASLFPRKQPFALALSRAGVSREVERRNDDAWLDAAWSDSRSRVLVLADGHALVRGAPAQRHSPEVVTEAVGVPSLVLLGPDAAPEGERYLLGVDSGGVAYFAVVADAATDLTALPGAAGHPAGLRAVGGQLGDRDAGLFTHAVGLWTWHRQNPFCPRCGTATEPRAAGHERHCPSCGTDHYPRTDPAMITLVLDDRDRCLLARNAAWPENRFSVLAGFVEPGEPVERTVAREVWEETRVEVGDVGYVASQPWPFPSSLMLGCVARAVTTELRVDGDEIAEARWFTREELASAVTAGELRLPSPVSIARHLIELWFGGPFE